ncbi:MAG: dTDP-4-dehydrorhamnose 3,5-epimerase family protein [Chloroflexi bacterium]|nr:dTDP-4-dehydrorhamnose 3,5-epimerase family protein [Chloroflexota bacterium]
MIKGVEIKELRVNADERGSLMEILRADDEIFDRFGQVYVSLNYPNVIRAWHYHKRQDDLFVVVKGMIKVVLYDSRTDSPTSGELNEFFLGERNNVLLRIPRGVMHGYKTVGTEPSLLLNFPTEVYNREEPDEYRVPFDSEEIPYDWALKHK